MVPRLGLALLLAIAGRAALAQVAPPPPIPACGALQPLGIPACRIAPPAGATAPYVPGVSLCRLSESRVRVESCAILPGTATIPPGGLLLSANFGLFFLDTPAAEGRLHAAPGNSRTCVPGDLTGSCGLLNFPAPAAPGGPAPGDPGTRGAPRQVVLLAVDADLPPDTPVARIVPRILAQLRAAACTASAPSRCDGATWLPSRSVFLPIPAPAR